MKNKKFVLKNLEDTNKLAQIIAKVAKSNLILLLKGPLGSGKTQMTKLIGKLLGINEIINSPTFIIWNKYITKFDWNLIHMDAYRLINSHLDEYYEIMTNNFMIIEWPKKLNINFNQYSYIEIDFKITSISSRYIYITTNNLLTVDEEYLTTSLSIF